MNRYKVACMNFLLGLVCLPLIAHATEIAYAAGNPSPPVVPEQQLSGSGLSSQSIRENSKFSLNASLAPLQVPFPMAVGLNANYVASENWLFGIDYQKSSQAIKVFSYELGELKEQSLTLQARRFVGNSFNWKLGIGHRRTETKLAQNLFDLVTNDYSMTVSELRANFFRFGFGNQWQFGKNYTVVADWFTINIPFNAMVQTSAAQYANSASSQQDIENAENILKYYPSGSVLQFEIGVMF